jgi:uncharacterized protein YbjT (DUF2867 family)
MVHSTNNDISAKVRRGGRPLVLVTGATGYVGGRLWRRLEALGYRVRCLARQPERLEGRAGPDTEVVRGDVLEASTLRNALDGVESAYYMVHSMGSLDGFEEQDREGARNFADAAREAGVKRIVYLGGLARGGGELSPHLRSRHEVGTIFHESGVPTIELRASIVLGSGSLSFEMIRSLVERLPAMVTPKWVSVEAQPIAINDLLDYLIESLDLPSKSDVFEIGGAERASYGDIMREYARQRGLHRVMVPIPLLTPRLSSLWLGLVTPLYARVGRKLIESIEHPSVIHDDSAMRMFSVRPIGLKDAIATALLNEEREFAESSWLDAISSAGSQRSWAGVRLGNRLLDARSIQVKATAFDAFVPIRRVGGHNGWYAHQFLWKLRGWLDLLVGGVGMRRGRRDPETLHVGDAVDFWRVESYKPDRLLRLRAEMKVPGRAWLEFEVEEDPDGSHVTISQTAMYDPEGLFGILYWYALYPLHGRVFSGMLRGIAARATRRTQV